MPLNNEKPIGLGAVSTLGAAGENRGKSLPTACRGHKLGGLGAQGSR